MGGMAGSRGGNVTRVRLNSYGPGLRPGIGASVRSSSLVVTGGPSTEALSSVARTRRKCRNIAESLSIALSVVGLPASTNEASPDRSVTTWPSLTIASAPDNA